MTVILNSAVPINVLEVFAPLIAVMQTVLALYATPWITIPADTADGKPISTISFTWPHQ
jgi:hypothetical protein